MMYSSKSIILVLALSSLLASSTCVAGDIVRTLRTNNQDIDSPDNFLEIGVGVGANIGSSLDDEDGKGFAAGVVASGSYNWKGFFIDLLAETSEPIVLGYNIYNTENWSYDITLGKTDDGLSEGTDLRFVGINDRKSSAFLGARATGYWGENIVQFSLKHDVSGTSKGTIASALIGRNWQVRNWNFHALTGLGFSDGKMNDYYLGVSQEEAQRTGFAEFSGESMISATASVGVTYPIAENWIFRGSVYANTNLGRNDSPLFAKRRDGSAGFAASIRYVF